MSKTKKIAQRTRPTSLTLRVGLGKLFGGLIGVSVFFSLPAVQPDIDLTMRFGMWGWYIVFGAVIALSGVFTKHPVFGWNLPPVLRGALIGFGLNLILGCLIKDDMMHAFEAYSEMPLAQSLPVLQMGIEGLIWGAILDAALTFYAGQGKDLVKKL